MKATDTYKQNAGGSTARQNKCESANQLADCGNKIRNYIAQITIAAVANNDHAANTQGKDTQFGTMLAQIKALTKAVAKTCGKQGKQEHKPKHQ